MSIEQINNYLRISDRIASSGQPDEHQFKWIASADFHAVVNLAMPNSQNAVPEEGNIVTSLRMAYVHIPVPFDAPTIDHLRHFINIMAAFSERKVWVHCALNYRVSAFLFHYQRLVCGASVERAKQVMLPSWRPNEVWQSFIAIDPTEIASKSGD